MTSEIGSNRLCVEHEAGEGRTRIDALSGVDRPLHSHLNSYTDLEIQGHRQLSLAFSPCPDTPIEVMPFEYPVGRPLRFACLDDDGLFRVVEARTGEKGPFRTLASGRLARGQPLSILLLDEGKPVARITLDDWSAQVGTALSPTAGSGLPVNSIEFSRAGDDAASSVHVFISLASTSVGRGFDSVTHAPGVYRNRIRVEPAIESAPPQ